MSLTKPDMPYEAAAALAALNSLPTPMVLCRSDRQLVFANRAARREIECGRWLRVREAVIHAGDPEQEMRLAAACLRLGAAADGSEDWLPGSPSIGETADIALRRLADGYDGPLILLSLVVHAQAPQADLLDRLGDRRKLPPRQRELAGHLLAGLSLDEAALCMGIGRRTVRDHLRGLFRATGASRQTELVARLSRETLS